MAEQRPSHSSPILRELQPAPERVAVSSDSSKVPAVSPKQAASKRKYPLTSEACDACRARKAKCSGPPQCQTCAIRGLECTYKFHEGKKQLVTRDRYENLQSRLYELEATINLFKVGSHKEVAEELRRLRNVSIAPPDTEDQGKSMGTRQKENQLFQTLLDHRREDWDTSNEAMSPTLASEHAPVESTTSTKFEIFHVGKLPSETDVRAAITAFEDGATKLFFIMTPAESRKILHRFYGADSNEFSKTDICLLCSFAAFGSHFIPDKVTEHLKQSLFQSALLLAYECSNDLASLCALSCLALFTFVDKKSRIRTVLASALQIARWMRLNGNIGSFSLEEYESFRKIYRSLVVLDSYLSTKFPHLSTVSADEVNFVVTAAIDDTSRPVGVDSFASELNSLAILAGNLTTDVYSSNRYGLGLMNSYMQQLAAWHKALPDELRLAILTGGTPEQHDRPNDMWMPILFLHEKYLSIVVLLHRDLIPSILEQRLAGHEWSIEGNFAAASECYSRAVLTAHQSISVNTLLVHTAGVVFRQCWLSVFQVFVGSCLLLADTALSIFLGSCEGIEENMDRIMAAMETMRCMRSHSVQQMAVDLLRILQPLFDEVKELQEVGIQTPQVHTAEPRAASLLQQTVQLLRHINQHRFDQALADASSPTPALTDRWDKLF